MTKQTERPAGIHRPAARNLWLARHARGAFARDPAGRRRLPLAGGRYLITGDADREARGAAQAAEIWAGYFSTPSEMPGALIEPLYLTDPSEASIAASAQGQQVIALAIAEAVDQYFAPANPG
jgi:N-acetylmuramoyl-L-alanine amidase